MLSPSMVSRALSSSLGSRGCHNRGALWAVIIMGFWGIVIIMGLSGPIAIYGLSGLSPSMDSRVLSHSMGLSDVITIMGLSGGGGSVTIMELSGDVTTDMGLLDMISKLFIMN